jgi:hypothetical protein
MKKNFHFLIILIAIVLFAQCNVNTNKQAEAVCTKDGQVNPNGDSELALLMRQMTKHTEATKKALQAGEELPAYPREVDAIDTAEPTNPDKHNPGFYSGTKLYLAALKALYASRKEDRAKQYEMVLNTCSSCHLVVCPGPLKKIGRLRMQDN